MAFKEHLVRSHIQLVQAGFQFRTRSLMTAYKVWKQAAGHNRFVQSRLAILTASQRHHKLQSAFGFWKEAADRLSEKVGLHLATCSIAEDAVCFSSSHCRVLAKQHCYCLVREVSGTAG